MKIVIATLQTQVRDHVLQTLSGAGVETDPVTTLIHLQGRCQQGGVDLVLLDPAMLGGSPLGPLLEVLRRSHRVPILLLLNGTRGSYPVWEAGIGHEGCVYVPEGPLPLIRTADMALRGRLVPRPRAITETQTVATQVVAIPIRLLDIDACAARWQALGLTLRLDFASVNEDLGSFWIVDGMPAFRQAGPAPAVPPAAGRRSRAEAITALITELRVAITSATHVAMTILPFPEALTSHRTPCPWEAVALARDLRATFEGAPTLRDGTYAWDQIPGGLDPAWLLPADLVAVLPPLDGAVTASALVSHAAQVAFLVRQGVLVHHPATTAPPGPTRTRVLVLGSREIVADVTRVLGDGVVVTAEHPDADQVRVVVIDDSDAWESAAQGHALTGRRVILLAGHQSGTVTIPGVTVFRKPVAGERLRAVVSAVP
jgi:hypothetical protein